MLIGFNWVNTHLTQLLMGWVWVDFATPSVIEEETKELSEKLLRTVQAVNDPLKN